MTSKSSFLTNLTENMKRRIWVLAVFCLYFFFAYPVASAVVIHSAMDEGVLSAEATLFLLDDFKTLVGVNNTAPAFILVLALLAGVQGFSWLHNQVKVDMYYSLPVSRAKRFGIIYLNGILIFALPYIAGLLFSGIIFLLMTGTMDIAIITAMLTGLLQNMLYYLCMYHLAIVCVMLTGNIVVTLLAYLVLNSYEVILKFLKETLYAAFFATYYGGEPSLSGLFSPVPTYVNAVIQQARTPAGADTVKCFILLAAFLLICGALAFFLFLKRPSEASGKSIAFPALKPVLKFFITVPCALLSALFFFSVSDGSAAFTVFGLLIGLLLCHALMEVIFEFDIRAAFCRKKQLLVCGAPALCIYLVFLFDLFHYNSYIPSPDSLESAAVIFTEDFIPPYIDENGDSYYGRYVDHALDNMRLANTGAVTALAANSGIPERMGSNYFTPVTQTDYIVKYRLKNGREVYRKMSVDYVQHADLIETVYSSPEYHTGTSQLYDGEFLAEHKLTASYYNGVEQYTLDEEQTGELLKIYLEDYKTRTFRQAVNDHPVGCITFSTSEQVNRYGAYTRNISYPVYGAFRTTGWLEAQGISVSYPLNADTVESVHVENDNRAAYDKSGDPSLSYDAFYVSIDYDDPEQLEQILAAVYPTGDAIGEASPHFSDNYYEDGSYVSITIQLKDAKAAKNTRPDSPTRFSFRKGEIPAFVLEDTAYGK